jgi:cation transport regulator ChaC
MPPSGVKKGTKRARQYEKIKRSARKRGASASRASEIAARTVNKARARSGQTKEQLYNTAKRLRIDGRSSMNKSQLQRAVAAKSR